MDGDFDVVRGYIVCSWVWDIFCRVISEFISFFVSFYTNIGWYLHKLYVFICLDEHGLYFLGDFLFFVQMILSAIRALSE